MSRRLDDAGAILVRALADPVEARGRATALLARCAEPEARAVALRALGLAVREVGEPEAARGHLLAAIATASAAGLDARAAQARLSLVGVLADLGLLDAALAEADTAGRVLRGADADRLLGHRALVLCRSGRFTEGLATGDAALERLRAADDPSFVAGLLNNRGLARAYRGELAGAEADLEHAITVAESAGLARLAAMSRANLGFVALRCGDIPQALALYAQAEPEFADTAGRARAIDVDRAGALLYAGLAREARRLLGRAADGLTACGYALDAAEARLLLAQAELACGDASDARVTARAAGHAFDRQDRRGWALLAEHTTLRARAATGSVDRDLCRDACRSAERLDAWGWRHPALQSRILAAQAALDAGRPPEAARILAAHAVPPRDGTASERIAAWHATALYRVARGTRRAAFSAAQAGLRELATHTATLGAAELRAHAAGHGSELAELGLRLARESRRASTVLAWAERRRLATGRPAPVRPPRDPRLAHGLAELRRAGADLAAAIADERPHGAQLRRRDQAEEFVRRRARTSTPDGVPNGRTTSHRGLTAELDDRALVEYAWCDGELLAVSLVNGRHRLHELGPFTRVATTVTTVRFTLNRLAQRHLAGGDARAEAVRRALTQTTGALDELLVAPLRRVLGDRELVVVPCGALHAVPWAALPSTAGRPVTVVPSAVDWVSARASGVARPHGRVVLVAGPGVPHATAELDGLAASYPAATRLTGADAVAERVAAELDGAWLAHIGAHAVFRPGNALFSEIVLSDGPLFGYDLEAIDAPPRLVVLSACEAGRGDVTAGETTLGLVATLLSGGTATVIASVAPVHDAETATFMIELHRRIAAGQTPARALAAVPRTSGVLGFVCMGAG